MTETKKKVEQVSLSARINTALDIEKDFDHLFTALYLIDKEATLEKRDVINVLKTYKEFQIFKGKKVGICDTKGEPI